MPSTRSRDSPCQGIVAVRPQGADRRRRAPVERRAVPRHRRARVHRRLGGDAARPRGRARRRLRPRRRRSPPRASSPTPEEIAAIDFVRGDVTDLEQLERTLAEHEITHVVHLAALQVPFVKANPPLGASVNVVGTVNVFEAARRHGLATPIAYASTAAVYDDRGDRAPRTLYGVFKIANEGTAQRLLGRRGRGQRGHPPLRRLRPRPRPGRDLRPDARDGGGGARRAVPHRLRRPHRAALRARRRARVHRRRPLEAARAVAYDFPGHAVST